MPSDAEERSSDEAEEHLVRILVALEQGMPLADALRDCPTGVTATIRRRLEILGTLDLSEPGCRSRADSVGNWRLEELLGKGGMGEVWRATRPGTGQEVALKLVRTATLARTHRRRFQREARALSRLRHPGIVRLLETGEADGCLFLAMELLDGVSLATILRDGPDPSVAQLVRWGREIALALQAAHAVGVVHRDIKPSNIQITGEGHAVLMDFGLTRGLGPSSLSITGRFVGSPHYAAPEQVRGSTIEVGPQTDVYGLGATLYEALAGAPPFEGSSTEQLFHRILTMPPVSLRARSPGLPVDLETVILCALEKSPSRRYGTAAEFAADLGSVAELHPIRARRPGPGRRALRWSAGHRAYTATALSVVLVAAGFLGWDLWKQRRDRIARQNLARTEIHAASAALDEYLQREAGLPGRIERYQQLKSYLEASPFDPEATQRLDALQEGIEATERQRELVFSTYLERIRRAENLDPELAEQVAHGRARLFLERWRFAKNSGEVSTARFYAERVRSTDPVGDLIAALEPTRRIRLSVTPSDARVDAFVYRRLGEISDSPEPRLVPIPIGGIPPGVQPGRLALSVLGAVPPLVSEDLVLSVDGAPIEGTVFARLGTGELLRLNAVNGNPVWDVGSAEDALAAEPPPWKLTFCLEDGKARLLDEDEFTLATPLDLAGEGGHEAEIWHGGARMALTLPPGLLLRPTAAALYRSAASRLAPGPGGWLDLPRGDCLLLVSATGFEPLRISLDPLSEDLNLVLDPLGGLPSPFRRVSAHRAEMILMDREVSEAEYAEYLSSDPSLELPSSWTRDADGNARSPNPRPEITPVCSIRYLDAVAYAGWRTRRARAQGHPWTFRLPNVDDWLLMTQAEADFRPFVWGEEFRTQYTKGCFARKTPRPEPMLRFPVDETMLGIHDTAGGVAEFCRGWFWKEQGQRPVCGGSWVHGDPRRFRSKSQWGAPETADYEFVGFRLELVRDE